MSRSIPRRNIVIFCILGLDLHDTVGSVLWGWTASFHSPFSSNGLQHTFLLGWEFCVAWGKKTENPFLCYLCNTYLYSVEIERYYMKNVYLKDLNLKNYIVCTCFFLHQSRCARKQRYLAARRALPGTVPPAPSQFSHPRTPSYALSTQ